MDVVLRGADRLLLDKAYASLAPSMGRDNVARQCISLYIITLIATLILYFGIAGLSYLFIYDKRMMRHPRFLKNQVRLEIKMSVSGFPILDIMTLPWFLGECRGYSLMYEGIENSPFGNGRAGGIAYIVASSALFLWFTDFLIYIVHRVLHWPSVYKRLHKPHHRWVIPTPFSSHAFHPLDGYLQSLPYHIFVYIVPLHKYTYIGLFIVVNLWSIFIHDSDMIVGHPLERIINGPAHHTLHHMYFVYNYGQYFTWADRAGGSYRHPVKSDDPLHAVLAADAKKLYAAEKEAMRILDVEERSRSSSSRSAVELCRAESQSSGGVSSGEKDRSDSGFETGSTSGSECSDGGGETTMPPRTMASATSTSASGGKKQARRRK